MVASYITMLISFATFTNAFRENMKAYEWLLLFLNHFFFENCEIFSTYYFSYVRGYKAALRGGNNSNVRKCYHIEHTCQYNKSSIKTRSFCNKRGYLLHFFYQLKIMLDRLSLHLPPATLQL